MQTPESLSVRLLNIVSLVKVMHYRIGNLRREKQPHFAITYTISITTADDIPARVPSSFTSFIEKSTALL